MWCKIAEAVATVNSTLHDWLTKSDAIDDAIELVGLNMV